MNTKKLTLTAILSALALAIFVIEAQLPPIGMPGIKLGLSNVVILTTMIFVSVPSALAVMLIKVTLGAVFCGNITAFFFSLTGGVLSFIIMAVLVRLFDYKQLWVVSVFGAIFHSIGQLIVAYILIGSRGVLTLLPILLICSIISGALTGLLVQRLWFSPLKRFSISNKN